MTASIEAQQLAIVGLRRGWLVPMKAALDATGRLSDVARCYRLSRLLEVNQEALSVEEELKKYLAAAANQRLSADLKMAMDAILKASIYLLLFRACSLMSFARVAYMRSTDLILIWLGFKLANQFNR